VFPGVTVAAQQLDILGVVSSFGVFLPVLDVIQMQLSVRLATAHTAASIEPQDSVPKFLPHPPVLDVHPGQQRLMAFGYSIVGERCLDFGRPEPPGYCPLFRVQVNAGLDVPTFFF
jgi:hypothetical protein